eukprot:CAMPEP_0181327334 /NCGR_PEP_ID=MMETSP1101-20121128/22041_1 /TAXON_ID=46948 /ORGANISM="Rhodomonas abbreviata, Strain Caron Lab Isolate" /LENGTH=203 /DNA_ID=CAMNT_0023435977 /DNA_START=80 /DNA_END=691 /DNA_ORIENTATION=+
MECVCHQSLFEQLSVESSDEYEDLEYAPELPTNPLRKNSEMRRKNQQYSDSPDTFPGEGFFTEEEWSGVSDPEVLPTPNKVFTACKEFSSRSWYNRKVGASLHLHMVEHLNQAEDSQPPQRFSRNRAFHEELEHIPHQRNSAWIGNRSFYNRLIGAWCHEETVAAYAQMSKKQPFCVPTDACDSHDSAFTSDSELDLFEREEE